MGDMTDLKNELALATVNAMIKAVRRVRESGEGATLDPNLPPFANLDPERYDYVEKLVAANAHMMPSVTRFHALCNILSRGFKLAYETPVDIDLAKRNWLSACLEMMTENPLLNPRNDWKITLTIPDAQLLAAAFAKAVGNMIKWADSVRQTEPLADIDEWGGLIAAIYKTFIAGHEVFHDNEWKAELTDKAILRQNDNGNMQIDDRNIRSILAACEVHNAVASYKTIQLPPDKLTEVNCGNAGIEFDHAYVCQIIDAALRICHQDMVERITMHDGTDNLAERRAALSFTSGKNTWFDYYVKEYCAPAKWHLSKCRDPEVEEADLPTNFGILDKMSQLMCQFLVNDTGGSELAMQVSEEWEDIHAIFATRCLGKAMPSFAEQVAFCTKLSVFMEHFAKAADSIGRAPQKRETPEQIHKPTLEDIFSLLTENTDLVRAMSDKMNQANPPQPFASQNAPQQPKHTDGKQIARHRKICGYILTALQQWRENLRAELIANKYAAGIVKAPTSRELTDLINALHAGEQNWHPLKESKVRRHLENAIGMKIDDTKFVVNPEKHARPATTEKRRLQITKNAPVYVDHEICLYWAALSLGLNNFVLAKHNAIRVNARLKASSAVFKDAVGQAPKLWPN